MADMLKALPTLTVDEYLWGHSASFIKMMAYDQSRIRYLSKKEIEKRKKEKENRRNRAFTAEDVIRSLGIGTADAGFTPFTGDWKTMINERQKELSEKNQQQE